MSAEDEEQLQALLKQLLRSVNERLSNAPSPQSAEEILLHLEETDRNFHNYEFVKYLRHYVDNSLGSVVDEEIRKLTSGDGQPVNSGHDTLIHSVISGSRASEEYQKMMQTLKATMMTVAESLISRFEEDQLKKEEMQHSLYADECSDSDSSFNQSYAFIRQEQLQALAEKLDASQPEEVRKKALQALCCAPPSDVLCCESWNHLRQNLCAMLIEPNTDLSDNVLQFFAKSFSSSPLNVTREIYTTLAKSVESIFLSLKLSLTSFSTGLDINRPEISSLLKQMRLMNDFQKEVTAFWIRHPEKYMEEIIESTFSLLCLHLESRSHVQEKVLQPIYFLALLDVEAAWFKKWMHGSYSRTVVLRLLQSKYKSLIEAAVQQSILFLETCQDSTHLQSEEQHSAGQRSIYTAKELQYALVVHSLSILGKLLLYTNGRKLFPITVRTRKDPVSLTDLVVVLITIMYQYPKPLCSDILFTDSLSPSSLVMSALWMMSERTKCADECLHQTTVIETLLAPVIALLRDKQANLKSPKSTLPLIADVLARMVNTDRGLALFLYERNLPVAQSERTSAAHVVVQFTLKLLDEELLLLGQADTPRVLCGAFIFVCRQMYNTCEGLQVLRPYGLHKAASAAWRKTSFLSERVLTPGNGNNPGMSSTQEMPHMLMWEETLLDSLLNFAATPKGLLLLQQTGAMQECVSHMFSRFSKKMQVSRCEKFGYGVMVTQVAATGAGMKALHRSGFVRVLVLELWSALECGSEDGRVVRPKSTPLDPIDRSCLKSFLSLVNVLSSYQSVWQLLAGQPLANKTEYTLREVPSSVPDVIDRLISVNSAAKIHSLFHYEQSHTFGLRLLSVLCSSLDSFLLLESQYNICSMLLQSQRENVADQDASDGSCIIDNLSVERNHVLVRVALVGGPCERRLPPRALQEGDNPYPWPMFSSYPPPSCYILHPPNPQHYPLEPEMSAFLTSPQTTWTEENWIEMCRRLYRRVMTSGHNALSGTVLADLVEKAVVHLSKSSAECVFPPPQHKEQEKSVEDVVLSPVENLGMNICLRYGHVLQLLQEDAASSLTLLMKHVKIFLSRQRVQTSSELLVRLEDYPGHDWLASTVFLIMAGNWRRCLSVLVKLSSLLSSALIWPARTHASVVVTVQVAKSGIPPVYWSTAHYVEMLLKAELPLVHSAFRMSGFTPSQMCLHWLAQCFWNFLDWPEICHYVCTCVLLGPDYQVYTCLALFKHLQPDLLERTQSSELQVFLKEEPIKGFKFCDYLEFMEVLERRYRNIVLTDMKTIGHPIE
ncbi:protein broad-minded isoform X1 [Entelurus aequoreus]|uniref:protein broad-minded isoform X1 n=1 Tax=Entelurus aequoreus TaxID=161455 RepID=UPI002B1DDE23|nr:protein broad-minded isoform X1 [Entelurus aequoreus]